MLDLNMMDKIHARPPPPAELTQAWITFINYKNSRKETLNNLQAQHVVRTFKHLQKVNREEEGFGLTMENLIEALKLTAFMPKDNREMHAELARLLYDEIARRPGAHQNDSANISRFVRILAGTGYSGEARDIAVKFNADLAVLTSEASLRQRETTLKQRKAAAVLWTTTMEGYAKENNEEELLRTVEMAEEAGLAWGQKSREIMTTFYASKDDVSNTKHWYSKTTTQSKGSTTPELMSTILHFCIRNNELNWCKAVFRGVVDTNPAKPVWDVLFQWAAGTLGKGVEDVERMIDIMILHNSGNEDARPDAETINGLVELAMFLNDPYLAERYIVLGRKYNIRPNAQTYCLQMDYRISAGDLTGAQAAYEALQAEEIIDNCDLPVINKYIRALCASKANHYDRVVSICSDLEERKVRLEADTVSALCMLYLSRGEMNDVLDTLQANSFHYTLPERASIINAFVVYCLDRKHSTTESWEAYNLFRHVFQETPIEIRTKMMNEFFARKRSDMACHVFGHMRQHIRQEYRPVLGTYIDCFRGIAHCADKESLDMVHNMFKMDSSIEPNTMLYNSLMMAYTQCDECDRAMDFWDDITNSREGPSYESLELVFKACQGRAFGDQTAREVWSKMRRMEIEVTREVFVAYVCALAGQGKMEEAEGMIESAEKDLGLKPDTLM